VDRNNGRRADLDAISSQLVLVPSPDTSYFVFRLERGPVDEVEMKLEIFLSASFWRL
jgi:hypothetical protein